MLRTVCVELMPLFGVLSGKFDSFVGKHTTKDISVEQEQSASL